MDSSKKINIMLFENMDSSKLGKKSKWFILLKILEVQIILKSNWLMLLDIHI